MPLMKSWVESANAANHPFPLNNLPCGVFSTPDTDPRCGVAIGDMILDMQAAEEAGLISLTDDPLFDMPFWNDLMEEGPAVWTALRNRLTDVLAEGSAERDTVKPLLVPMAEADLHMPFMVSEYTDFYAGRHHADKRGHDVPRTGKRTAAELAAHPDRLQRSGLVSGCFRHRHSPSLGTAEIARPCGAGFHAVPPLRSRTGDGSDCRRGQRRPDHRRGGRPQ